MLARCWLGAGVWVLAWWVANSAEQGREAAKLAGSRGRGVAGGGSRLCRQHEAWAASRVQPWPRAARHERAAAAPGVASSNLAAMEGVEQKGNGSEGARRILSWLNAKFTSAVPFCNLYWLLQRADEGVNSPHRYPKRMSTVMKLLTSFADWSTMLRG